nr:hypothetical protein [Chlamydiota bacterium]
MSKFPEALPIDRKIIRSRLSRRKELLLTARRGVLLRAVIIVAELLGFIFLKSSALMLDALSCSIDVIASLILMWCIRLADKP